MHLPTVVRQVLTGRLAQRVAHEAGTGTGDYLLLHRMPRAAQRLLRLMSRPIASRLIVAAILGHSWTLEGSGCLRATVGPPPVFILERCPLCRSVQSADPRWTYYAATVARLFQELVEPTATAIDTDCAAVSGGSCRFELRWV